MDPFLNIPDELIIKICNSAENPELLNLAESSSKVYQICSDIIKERRHKLYNDMSTYYLISLLGGKEDIKDIESLKILYRILYERSSPNFYGGNHVESDFWREVYLLSPEWVLDIVSSIRPLSIHDAVLVQSPDYFDKLLSRKDIDMEDYDSILENLYYDPDNKEDIRRAELIKRKIIDKY